MVRSTDVLFDHFFILFKRRIFETRTRVVITGNSMLYVVLLVPPLILPAEWARLRDIVK